MQAEIHQKITTLQVRKENIIVTHTHTHTHTHIYVYIYL